MLGEMLGLGLVGRRHRPPRREFFLVNACGTPFYRLTSELAKFMHDNPGFRTWNKYL